MVDINCGLFDCVLGLVEVKLVIVVFVSNVIVLGLLLVDVEVLCDCFVELVEMCWVGL